MAAPQAGSQADHSAGILWSVAAFFAAMAGVWFGFKPQIVYFYLSFKLWELNIVAAVSHFFNYRPAYFAELRSILESAKANAAVLDFSMLAKMGGEVGSWISIPLAILLLVLAAVVFIGNTTRVFKRAYNMEEFANLEKENWPQIIPVVNLDLLKTDIDTGPWAMAMTPLQFCKRYHLLEEVRPERVQGVARKNWNRVDVVLKRGEANKIFALQLGALWQGVEVLPPHTKALFAAFAARINADTKAAEKLLKQLNLSCKQSQLNLAGVDDLLNKHFNTKLVQQVVQSHAYVLTVMASMLKAAREDGVQASADFLWLKPLDRRLWYTLNTVGRQTPFIEVAGIFAHWIAEVGAARKLLVPVIEEATNATEIALKEVIYRQDE
jgi:intracellular multiplication protein IcmP